MQFSSLILGVLAACVSPSMAAPARRLKGSKVSTEQFHRMMQAQTGVLAQEPCAGSNTDCEDLEDENLGT